MQHALTLMLLFWFTFNSDAQNILSGRQFKTDILVGSTDYGWTNQCKHIDLIAEPGALWGYFLKFNDDGTFVAFNQNRCGNDCRVKVSGKYIIDNNQVELILETILYKDICVTRPKEEIHESMGVFKMEKEEEQIRLLRL